MQRSLDTVIEKYIYEKLISNFLQESLANRYGRNLKLYCETLTPNVLALKVSNILLGITESGGDNRGELVDSILRSAGGTPGLAWCAALQQVVEAFVEKYCNVTSSFPNGLGCVQIYQDASKKNDVFTFPELGDVMVWQSIDDNGKPLATGHMGRVVAVGDILQVVEGNTGPGSGIQREGDGVYKKLRLMDKKYRTMQLLGYIRPEYNKKEEKV